MQNFENVTIVKQANVYHEGKVSSRTVLFADGTRKTLGFMLPGDYEFPTAEREEIEILAGSVELQMPGSADWVPLQTGASFEIPAGSTFGIRVLEPLDYCCSYFAD